MITVPVSIGFNAQQVIGSMTIDETQLPPNPKFVFSIGYLTADIASDEYTLVEIGLVPDHRYAEYVKLRNN